MTELYYYMFKDKYDNKLLDIETDSKRFVKEKNKIQQNLEMELLENGTQSNSIRFDIDTLTNVTTEEKIKNVLKEDQSMSLWKVSKKADETRSETIETLEYLKEIGVVFEPEPDRWQLL